MRELLIRDYEHKFSFGRHFSELLQISSAYARSPCASPHHRQPTSPSAPPPTSGVPPAAPRASFNSRTVSSIGHTFAVAFDTHAHTHQSRDCTVELYILILAMPLVPRHPVAFSSSHPTDRREKFVASFAARAACHSPLIGSSPSVRDERTRQLN